MPRNNDDSWDLASSVGVTATIVATARALAAQGSEPLLDDPYVEPLVRAVGLPASLRILDVDTSPEDDPTQKRSTSTEQMLVWTRFFDDFFIGATGAGIGQAVILASGLDTRPYRLGWPAGTVVYEIDQPGVIEFKTRTLADLGATPSAEHRAIGIDLRDDWPAALRAGGFEVDQPTAWSAEGLLPYLSSEAQDRLFDNITALSAPGSQLATEHIPDQAASDEGRQRFTERWQSEGFDLDAADLLYQGERNFVGDYLNGHGWQVKVHPASELYQRNGFALPDAEAVGSFRNMSYIAATLK